MSMAITGARASWTSNRWNQLLLGVIAMMAISSPQYVWTLFTAPLNQKLGTSLAEVQWTVSLLVILQTWFSPFQAYLVDRFGPRLLISIGALLALPVLVLAVIRAINRPNSERGMRRRLATIRHDSGLPDEAEIL